MQLLNEKSPTYGIDLIDSLPLTSGGMSQAMPDKEDLSACNIDRVSNGYEVLLCHFLNLVELSKDLAKFPEQVGGGQKVKDYLRKLGVDL